MSGVEDGLCFPAAGAVHHEPRVTRVALMNPRLLFAAHVCPLLSRTTIREKHSFYKQHLDIKTRCWGCEEIRMNVRRGVCAVCVLHKQQRVSKWGTCAARVIIK